MPQAQNLTVKNVAGADKTFALVNPSAGDGGIALWALKEGTISAVFPQLTASAAKTGNRSRKLTVKYRQPSSYTDSVTGLTAVGSAAEVNTTVSIPDDFPEGLKDDFVAFYTNIVRDPLFQAMMRDAYPAT